MDDAGIPELTSEQVEKLCELAEEAVRKHVLSKVPLHRIVDIDLTIDINGAKPITVNVDLEIALSPLMKGYDVKKLVREATENAFTAIEVCLREFAWKSEK